MSGCHERPTHALDRSLRRWLFPPAWSIGTNRSPPSWQTAPPRTTPTGPRWSSATTAELRGNAPQGREAGHGLAPTGRPAGRQSGHHAAQPSPDAHQLVGGAQSRGHRGVHQPPVHANGTRPHPPGFWDKNTHHPGPPVGQAPRAAHGFRPGARVHHPHFRRAPLPRSTGCTPSRPGANGSIRPSNSMASASRPGPHCSRDAKS